MGNLKIGQDLSLVIYLRDPTGQYDVAVRDCWAYDDAKIDDDKTLRLQLTTSEGCIRYSSVKDQLLFPPKVVFSSSRFII